MRLLLDHNLSHKMAKRLATTFPGTTHVRDLGLAQATDQAIWEFARREDLIIVTKDDDFRQIAFLRGHPPKVIWLRIANAPTSALESLLLRHAADITDFAGSPDSSVLVLG